MASHVPTVLLFYSTVTLLLNCVNTHLPEGIETVPKRFAISYRNKWMIEQSDIVVTYVTHTYGGAWQFKAMAEKQGKTVIEVSE